MTEDDRSIWRRQLSSLHFKVGVGILKVLVIVADELEVMLFVVLVVKVELVKVDDAVGVEMGALVDGSSGTGSSPSWIRNMSDKKSCQSSGLLASPNILKALERSLYFPDGMLVPFANDWNLLKPTLLNLPMCCNGKFV